MEGGVGGVKGSDHCSAGQVEYHLLWDDKSTTDYDGEFNLLVAQEWDWLDRLEKKLSS